MGSAAALILVLVPGAAMAAEPRDTAPVCEDQDGGASHSDVEGTTHEEAIACVSAHEIAEGYEDGTYRPGVEVTRAQMAAFVGRTLITADAVSTETAENLESGSFPDTPGTHHEAYIELLAELGVVQGKNDGTFGYNDPVTRGQMAAFLTRAIDQAHGRELDQSMPPEPEGDDFDDTEGSKFEDLIQQLADQGIYVGDGEGTADPGGHVTRGQMASFLARTAAYLDEIRRWRPTYEPIDYTVPMSAENVTDGEGNFGQGEEGATGAFRIVVDEIERLGAYAIQVDGVTGPYPSATAVSVNRGEIDENGPPVIVPSENPNDDLAADEQATGQLTIGANVDLDALATAPEGFYVEVRTTEYPEGAIRGQLPDGGSPGGALPIPVPEELQDLLDELIGQLPGSGDDGGGGDGNPLDPILDLIGEPELPGLPRLGGDSDAGGDGTPLDPILDPILGPVLGG